MYKKPTVRLPGLWTGLGKGDCYLPGNTRPRGQARVYTFEINRKLPRPEEQMWKLNATLVKDYLKN